MYFWKVNELARELKEGKMTEKEQMKYFLAYSIFIFCSDYLPTSPWEYPLLGSVEFGVGLIILVYGTVFCFRVNQKGDNRNFVSRMLCLGVPISVRLITMYLVILIIYVYIFGPGQGLAYDILWSGIILLFSVYYFVLLRKYLLYISHDETGGRIKEE